MSANLQYGLWRYNVKVKFEYIYEYNDFLSGFVSNMQLSKSVDAFTPFFHPGNATLWSIYLLHIWSWMLV